MNRRQLIYMIRLRLLNLPGQAGFEVATLAAAFDRQPITAAAFDRQPITSAAATVCGHA
jgi:hypothetical protein